MPVRVRVRAASQADTQDTLRIRGFAATLVFMRRVPFALLFLLLCLLAAAATSQARSLYFGINANTEAWGDPGEEQDRVLETGAHWLREDLNWEEVEPADDEWNWTNPDELYERAAERGMRILPVLYGSPCWAVPVKTDPEDCWDTYPVANAEYAEFVAHAAARYGPGGDFWEENPELDDALASRRFELWNEPYYAEFSNDDVDPAHYAHLYKAAVAAGREANPASRYLIESTVDATLPGGESWAHWAEAIVEAEPTIGSYIDGIAVHPYPGSHDPDYEPENGTDNSFKNTDLNYQRWREEGINKPVWITEVGYSSCDDGADRCVPGATQTAREEQKADWLRDLFDELGEDRYAFVHAVFLYNLRQWENAEEPNGSFSTWLGILNPETEPLRAWGSYATAVEEYDGVPVPNSTITGYSVEGSDASFSFTVNDATASPECKLDGGAWTACASPKKYTGVSTGSHGFAVRATNGEATEGHPAEIGWARRAPGTVADDAGTGTLTWSNVGNAKSADNFYATAEVSKSMGTAHYLKATNFGFSVPGGETILGIQASIERSESTAGTGEVTDSRIRIVKAGSIKSTVDKSTGAKWPSVDKVIHFGGGGDLWGNAWTTSDINSSGFGVALSPVVKGVGGSRKAQVDEIEMTVFWG
jgi:hypothetical protein